jgi:uncharacterized protein (DUF1501 family)
MSRPTLTRRQLLRGAAAGCAAWAVPPLFARGAAAAETAPVVVVVFLRGGADALSLVVPLGDPLYAELRPTIALSPGETLPLDGFFGLHAALAPLAPLWNDGALAIAHAVGSPDPTRSHFGAQDALETAAPGRPAVRDGWLARWLATLGTTGAFAGITIGSSRTLSMTGDVHTASLVSLDSFQAGGLLSPARRDALAAGFAAGTDLRLRAAAEEMFDTQAALADVSRQTAVAYPPSIFGGTLRDAAALIKSPLGVRAVAVDLHGWDHHGEERHELPVVARDFAEGLAAFHRDLGAHVGRTLVLVTTEFGRTAAENGGGGTDHGHGGVLFALGAGVRGGRVHLRGGRWPGLRPADLWEGRDLAVTTDFRDVYAEVLRRHLGVADPGALLAGFATSPANELGLLA